MNYLLENNKVYEIVFTKLDGTQRKMNCTRNLDLIPQALRPKGSGRISTSEERVFDLDKNEWRSFRRSSLLSIREIESIKL